jgi:hypothetical protein
MNYFRSFGTLQFQIVGLIIGFVVCLDEVALDQLTRSKHHDQKGFVYECAMDVYVFFFGGSRLFFCRLNRDIP